MLISYASIEVSAEPAKNRFDKTSGLIWMQNARYTDDFIHEFVFRNSLLKKYIKQGQKLRENPSIQRVNVIATAAVYVVSDQRNAIQMVFRWQANCDPLLCASGGTCTYIPSCFFLYRTPWGCIDTGWSQPFMKYKRITSPTSAFIRGPRSPW